MKEVIAKIESQNQTFSQKFDTQNQKFDIQNQSLKNALLSLTASSTS